MEITLSSADCRKAAVVLEAAFKTAPAPQLMQICAGCLYEIADSGPSYTPDIHVGLAFLSQAEKIIQALYTADSASPELLHDLAFELVECFAVIAKENSLNGSARDATAAQAEVMRYFEESGEWSPNDGTLVTQYYYLRIPDAKLSGATSL